jgi:hypothetical protein
MCKLARLRRCVMFKPTTMGREAMGDPREPYPVPATDILAVLLLMVGTMMILSPLMVPLGVIIVCLGLLFLLPGVKERENRSRKGPASGEATAPRGRKIV